MSHVMGRQGVCRSFDGVASLASRLHILSKRFCRKHVEHMNSANHKAESAIAARVVASRPAGVAGECALRRMFGCVEG